MGSNPVQAWIFFRPSIHYCLSSVHNCEDRFHIHVFIRSSNIWLSYIHSRLFTTSRVYSERTWWPAPSWLVSSVGRVVHRYRRGHRFISRTGLSFFFRPSFHYCLSFFRKHFFPTSSSCKQFFPFFFPVFSLFVLNITIALLNYFTKNLINSTIATYFVDIRSTHL